MSRSAELGTEGRTGRAGSSGLQAPRATGCGRRAWGRAGGISPTSARAWGLLTSAAEAGKESPGVRGSGGRASESQVEEESNFPRTLPGSRPRGRRPEPRGHRRLCHRLSPIAGPSPRTSRAPTDPSPTGTPIGGCWLSQAGVPLAHSGPGDSPRPSPGSLLALGVSAPSPGPPFPARDPSQPLPAGVPSLGSPGSPTPAASLPPRRVPARSPATGTRGLGGDSAAPARPVLKPGRAGRARSRDEAAEG